MKQVKRLISVTFLIGILGILGAIYFALTRQVIQTQLLIFIGLVLVTIALFAALIITTKEIQKVKVVSNPPEPRASAVAGVMEILLSAFMYR